MMATAIGKQICRIMINCLFKGFFQFIHGLAVEGYNIANARQAAKENTILGVKLNASGLSRMTDKALVQFNQILKTQEYYPALIKMGNIYYLKGQTHV